MAHNAPKYANIDFLPVCSNCHQVLYGEMIENKTTYIPVHFDAYKAEYPAKHIYQKRCPHCMAEFIAATMPQNLPFYCEPLWPISVEE